MSDTTIRPVPPPPPDPGLPTLGLLVQPDCVRERLATTVPDGARIGSVRVDRIVYLPGRRVQITWRVDVDGDNRLAVGTCDAVGPAHERAGVDEVLGAHVRWYPDDPALPALANGDDVRGSLLRRAGHPPTGDAPTLLGYRPGERAVLAAGDAVLKLYRRQDDPRRAELGFGWARAALGDAAPRLRHVDHVLRATVQDRIDGVQLAHEDAVIEADQAGALLGALHDTPGIEPRPVDPSAELRDALVGAGVARQLLPDLAGRIDALTSRLSAAVPVVGDRVPSHGDFNVSQMIRRADGTLALLDFDEHCLASPGYDIASYAANVVSGRDGDLDRAVVALDGVIAGYGRVSHDLDWHMSVAILRRAPSPFRLQKRKWPQRMTAIVLAAERAFTA